MKKICALIIAFAMLVSSMGAFATGATISELLGGTTPEGIRWRYNDESRSEIWILGFDHNYEMPETLIIPDKITSWSIILQKDVTAPVTKIRESAFESCDKIKYVSIPNSVTAIYSHAFAYCENLESIELPDTLTSIGEVETNDLPGNVFYDCNKLTYIKIPKSLKSTCRGMFSSCDNLETVELEEGLEVIGESTFMECHKLKNITLPSTVKIIKDSAFADCRELEKIALPQNLSEIGVNAFTNTKISHVAIPESVTKFAEFLHGDDFLMKNGAVFPADTILYGVPGKFVEEFSSFMGFPFKPISEYPGNLPNYANSAGNTEVLVKVNNKYLTFTQPPIIENGKTLVPLRAIFEALGAEVLWDGNTKTVTATKGETKISLQIGSTQMYVNGVAKTLKVPAKIVNSKTLVPARAVSEAFGCTVDWIDATKTVVITQ